jgi:hypothetical protein
MSVTDNPYKPPSAPLGSDQAASQRRRGWRIYFWLMTALLLAAVVAEIVVPADDLLINAADYVLSGFSLVGLFGYAHRRIIFKQLIWRAWLPLILVWDLGVMLRHFARGDLGGDAATVVTVILFGTLVVVPLYVALYRYGYRSSELWGNDK